MRNGTSVLALAVLFAACGSGGENNGHQAEGYIFVFETKGGWGDYGGVKAYFTEQLHRRKVPGFLEVRILDEQQREGDCAFYLPPKGRSLRLEMCDPPCGGDQYCDGVACVDYPPHWNVGALQFTGLNAALDVPPDEFDNYRADGLAADLLPSSGEIRTSAAGGELAAFEMNSRGVPPLVVGTDTVALEAGRDFVMTWTPADPDSRVQLFLRAGIHWPALPAAIVCDAPDSQGQIVVATKLVDAFLQSAFVVQQGSDIMRYRNQMKTPFGKQVEFRVASVVEVGLVLP